MEGICHCVVRDSFVAAARPLHSITGITTIPWHSILPLHAGASQVWLNAPCTPAANVSMFSFRTRLTGIFPAYFFMFVLIQIHFRLSPPFSFSHFVPPFLSVSVSLWKKCKSKLMARLWRAQRYLQRGCNRDSGSWSNGEIIHCTKNSALQNV